MIFDGVFNIADLEVGYVDAANQIELILTSGLPVPVAPNQMGIMPLVKLHVLLQDQDEVKKLADELSKLAERLPKASKLAVASNLSDVEAQAQNLERFKSGG